MAELPVIETLFCWGGRKGSLDDVVVIKQRDSGEGGYCWSIGGQNLNHYQESFLLIKKRITVGVEETGLVWD